MRSRVFSPARRPAPGARATSFVARGPAANVFHRTEYGISRPKRAIPLISMHRSPRFSSASIRTRRSGPRSRARSASISSAACSWRAPMRAYRSRRRRSLRSDFAGSSSRSISTRRQKKTGSRVPNAVPIARRAAAPGRGASIRAPRRSCRSPPAARRARCRTTPR